MRSLPCIVALVCTALAAGGCASQDAAGGPGAAGMAMQVVAVEAKRQAVSESVSLVGSIAPNEQVEVRAEIEGIVEEILFREGEVVEPGQLLVRLDETGLAAELRDAEARLKLAEANFERARELLRDELISPQEFDQAAATFEVGQASVELRRRRLKDARVNAPFRGRTGARMVSAGQVITRNTVLTWLVDLDPVKVEMNVPERFLGQVRLGQKIDFGVAAYPGRRFEGEIYFIAPRLDLATRAALVKTRIANPDGVLKAGMVASLDLELQIRDAAVLVPEAALISNGDRYFVFLVGEEQEAVLQPVEVGKRLPRWAEITSGIEAGDLVVVEGYQKIGPGMPLRLAPPEKAAIYQTLDLRSSESTTTPEAAESEP